MTETPKLIFIVPYRDRDQQKHFFMNHMKKTVLEDMESSQYKIYFCHQNDNRSFNRGAMKNIGFLAMKEKYPNDYRDITFVFNDIDTMPYTKNFLNYETKQGTIKHFYGYEFALGGIVSICGSDFERINGYPNYWAWGYEDNLLNIRAKDAKLHIDRSQFYPIMDKNIMQLKDGLERVVNKKEFDRYVNRTNEGISSIHQLTYDIHEPDHFIDISYFLTEYAENKQYTKIHDLRKGSQPFSPPIQKQVRTGKMKMFL